MSDSFQKLTDGIIFYSLAVSDFEKLDFRDDALAGVRANYFNSGFSSQSDETEITIENVGYKMSYKMALNQPLSWKVSKNFRPYQSAKKETGGIYCVIYYAGNGVVYKRQYFDAEHIWLRTEYFDYCINRKLICRVYPQSVNGVVLLVRENFTEDNQTEKTFLFPSKVSPDFTADSLTYTNMGMIWYDERFMPENFLENFDRPIDLFSQNSFNLDASRFSEGCSSSDIIDLSSLDYLENEEIEDVVKPVTGSQQTENIDFEQYSAYDKIEKILIEAHKTNKNIFGEVIRQTGVKSKEIDGIKPNEEPLPDDFEQSDSDGIQFEQKQEESCNVNVSAKSGNYSYYGSLDENGMRTGKGRTVSPEGFTAYDGEYKNDKRDGFGVFYYKSGDINYVGKWLENKRNGAGIGYRLSDGTIHAGKWSGNKPDGLGARFDKDGNFIDLAFYYDGVKNGRSVSFDECGNICVAEWRNGEKISEQIIESGE